MVSYANRAEQPAPQLGFWALAAVGHVQGGPTPRAPAPACRAVERLTSAMEFQADEPALRGDGALFSRASPTLLNAARQFTGERCPPHLIADNEPAGIEENNLRPSTSIRAILAFLSIAVPTTYVIPAAYAREADIPFRSVVPNSWKLLPRDPHSPGRRFVSPSGDAWLRYFAVSVDPGAANSNTDQLTPLPTERVTYERRGVGWLVSSGYRGDRIFYRKAILACNGTKWRHIEFEYPASEKRLFDNFVTRTSLAMRAYQVLGCG